MKYLQSSIAIRIIDSLGVITKDLPDIRSDTFKTKHNNIWAVSTILNENINLIILYYEADMKYMLCGLKEKNIDNWKGIVCGDETEEEYELNNIFAVKLIDKEFSIREISIIEIGNLLVTFECIRNFFNGWNQYVPADSEIKTFKEFIKSISKENIEENIEGND
ncbi:MAG: hypothetical protein ACOYLO_00825 [Ferruginibacter sp.]